MMNPFLLSPRDRLADWKKLRLELQAMPEEEQLNRVAQYWAQAPVLRYAHDVEKPETWLTPWEMVGEGEWCRLSVAIGMDFTLRLAGWSPNRLRLRLFKDNDLSELFFVSEIDGTLAMNYAHGVVAAAPKTRQENICSWVFNGKIYVSAPH